MGTLKFLLTQQQGAKTAQGATAEEVQRQNQIRHVNGEASRLETEFLREQPDYDVTINPATGMSVGSPTYNKSSMFLMNMRRAEFAAIGVYNPIMQTVQQEAVGSRHRIQADRNPAQVVMDVAKARRFAPKPKQVAPEQPSAVTDQEKLSRIAKGRELKFSLSQAGGSKAQNNKALDAKSLGNMSD
jgi:hypothetical protein